MGLRMTRLGSIRFKTRRNFVGGDAKEQMFRGINAGDREWFVELITAATGSPTGLERQCPSAGLSRADMVRIDFERKIEMFDRLFIVSLQREH